MRWSPKRREDDGHVVLVVLEVEVEYKEEEEDDERVIWEVLRSIRGGRIRMNRDFGIARGRVGVLGGRTGCFECWRSRWSSRRRSRMNR